MLYPCSVPSQRGNLKSVLRYSSHVQIHRRSLGIEETRHALPRYFRPTPTVRRELRLSMVLLPINTRRHGRVSYLRRYGCCRIRSSTNILHARIIRAIPHCRSHTMLTTSNTERCDCVRSVRGATTCAQCRLAASKPRVTTRAALPALASALGLSQQIRTRYGVRVGIAHPNSLSLIVSLRLTPANIASAEFDLPPLLRASALEFRSVIAALGKPFRIFIVVNIEPIGFAFDSLHHTAPDARKRAASLSCTREHAEDTRRFIEKMFLSFSSRTTKIIP